MSASLLTTIRRVVAEELGRVRLAQLAVVEETHPHASEGDKDNYACTVKLHDTGVVLKRVPVATPRIGLVSVPAPGDLVLVQFIGGDANAPVILGSLYNDEDRPPASADGQAILHLPLGAGDSDAVHLEVTSGDARELILRLGDGLSVSLKDDDPVVSIDVASGSAVVEIGRDGTVEITSKAKVNIEGAEINIESSGPLNLKGSVVNIN